MYRVEFNGYFLLDAEDAIMARKWFKEMREVMEDVLVEYDFPWQENEFSITKVEKVLDDEDEL